MYDRSSFVSTRIHTRITKSIDNLLGGLILMIDSTMLYKQLSEKLLF